MGFPMKIQVNPNFHMVLCPAEGQEGFSQASEATALLPRQLGTLHSNRVALLASLTLPAWSPIFPCRVCPTLQALTV